MNNKNIFSKFDILRSPSFIKITIKISTETIFFPYYHIKPIFLDVRHFLFVSPQSVYSICTM